MLLASLMIIGGSSLMGSTKRGAILESSCYLNGGIKCLLKKSFL